jgi:hypothetical protein
VVRVNQRRLSELATVAQECHVERVLVPMYSLPFPLPLDNARTRL